MESDQRKKRDELRLIKAQIGSFVDPDKSSSSYRPTHAFWKVWEWTQPIWQVNQLCSLISTYLATVLYFKKGDDHWLVLKLTALSQYWDTRNQWGDYVSTEKRQLLKPICSGWPSPKRRMFVIACCYRDGKFSRKPFEAWRIWVFGLLITYFVMGAVVFFKHYLNATGAEAISPLLNGFLLLYVANVLAYLQIAPRFLLDRGQIQVPISNLH